MGAVRNALVGERRTAASFAQGARAGGREDVSRGKICQLPTELSLPLALSIAALYWLEWLEATSNISFRL